METLQSAFDAFLARYHNQNSRDAMAYDVGDAVAWLGAGKAVGDLHRLDVARYVSACIVSPDKNYLPNTMRTKLKRLVVFLNWLHNNKLTEDKLSGIIELPPEEDHDARERAYTDDECDQLIAYAAGETVHSGRRLRDLALFVFCYDTGARVASLARLRRGDISLPDQAVVLYNTKRRRKYKAKFGDYCADVLREWFDVLPNDPECFLWNARQPGQSMTPHSISQVAGRACDVLGIERNGIHGFRRAVGIRMVDAGQSLEYVADVLNDSVQIAAKHYAPKDIPAAKEAAQRLAYVPEAQRKLRKFNAG